MGQHKGLRGNTTRPLRIPNCPHFNIANRFNQTLKRQTLQLAAHDNEGDGPMLQQITQQIDQTLVDPATSLSSSDTLQPNTSFNSEKIHSTEYSKFVRFLHLASPYVAGHRSRTMVLAIPGEVVVRPDKLNPLLEDVLLLHGLGIRLVIVVGAKELIDQLQRASGSEPQWVGAYRVTDSIAIKAAIEAAGTIATELSARLSRAPSIPMVRRHARGDGQMHFAPAVQVITGNFVTAKRRGIVNGVDFGYMGQVRFVQTEPIKQQLEAGNIVVLTNIGISASGELLNCNTFDVSTHTAVELKADKLLCLTSGDVRELNLPHYLPLADAEELIAKAVCGGEDCDDEEGCGIESFSAFQGNISPAALSTSTTTNSNNNNSNNGSSGKSNGSSTSSTTQLAARSTNGNGSSSTAGKTSTPFEMSLDLDSWQQIGFPNAVLSAVVACKNGVNRAHLIDIESDGAMLLELYTRDGINGVCMIAADLYEGIRRAEPQDIPGIIELLTFLHVSGVGVPFPLELDQVADRLQDVIVIDREGKLLGCAVNFDLGVTECGERVFEVAAFVIHPGYRRLGFGDSLLDWVEQDLRRKGARRIVIVGGQGSYEWFTQRGFETAGTNAVGSDMLPEWRKVNVASVCKLFLKKILELDASLDAPAGKRIGF